MGSHGHAHSLPVEHAHADAWHHHEAAEGLPQTEHGAETNMLSLALWGGALVVTVVGAVGAIWMYFISYTNQEKVRKQETFLSADAMQYQARMKDQELKTYGWADTQANTVRVPLSVAKEKIITKYNSAK